MMAFTLSCTSLGLNGSELSAQCRNEHGQYVHSTIDLNHYLSNRNGEFYWKSTILGTGFVTSAKDISLADGAVLTASLQNNNGVFIPAYLNLNFCIANINGKLTFKKPDTHIAATCTCFSLRNNSIFTALCLTNSGKLAVSEIDLDAHFSNDNGKFVAGGKNFTHSAKDIRLDGLTLRASLNSKEASYDLDACLENIDGQLRFQKQYVPSPSLNNPPYHSQ